MASGKNTLASFLPDRIKQQNYNVSTFCVRVGITRRSYYNYMADTMRPSKALCLKMCEALDLAPSEIFQHITPTVNQYGFHRIKNYPKFDPKNPLSKKGTHKKIIESPSNPNITNELQAN